MQIRARMSMSADGYVTTPNGWPALTADPAFVSGESHGIREFLEGCEAALMGRTTFEPALTNNRWPWPHLDVFVLGSHRPDGTPDHVTTDSDTVRLLEKLRSANRGRDVHLIGGPADDRGVPRPGRTRHPRTGRTAAAVRRWDATDTHAQSRQRADLPARACPARRFSRDRLLLPGAVALNFRASLPANADLGQDAGRTGGRCRAYEHAIRDGELVGASPAVAGAVAASVLLHRTSSRERADQNG